MTIEIDIDKLTELLIDAREYAADGTDTHRAIRNIDEIGFMFDLDLENLSVEADAQFVKWFNAQANKLGWKHNPNETR